MQRKEEHGARHTKPRQQHEPEHARRDDRRWADEAAKARTADDVRARTPRDAAGQPTTRSFDE